MASEWGYILTEKANVDLDNIVGYVTMELANPRAASIFLKRFIETLEETCTFPKSGSLVVNEYLSDAEIRSKTIGNYIMIYQPTISMKKIIVLRILYGRRNINEILRHLDIQGHSYRKILVKEKHLTKQEIWCRIPQDVKQKSLTLRRHTWKRWR